MTPRPIHPDLARLVMRLLSKNREDRPRNAAEALEEMLRIEDQFIRTPSPDTAGLPVPSVTTGTTLYRRKRRRMRNWAIGIGVALLLGVAGAAALVSLVSPTGAPTEREPAMQGSAPPEPTQAVEGSGPGPGGPGDHGPGEGHARSATAGQGQPPLTQTEPSAAVGQGESLVPGAAASAGASQKTAGNETVSRPGESVQGGSRAAPSRRTPAKASPPGKGKEAPKGAGGWSF